MTIISRPNTTTERRMPEIFRLRPCPHAVQTRKRATTHSSRKSTKTKSAAARGPRVKHAVAARGPRVKHVTYVPVVTWGVKRHRSSKAKTTHGPSRPVTKAVLVNAMAGKSYRNTPWKKSSAKIVRSAVRRKLASADLRYSPRVTAQRFDKTRRRLVGAPPSVNLRTRPRKWTPSDEYRTNDARLESQTGPAVAGGSPRGSAEARGQEEYEHAGRPRDSGVSQNQSEGHKGHLSMVRGKVQEVESPESFQERHRKTVDESGREQASNISRGRGGDGQERRDRFCEESGTSGGRSGRPEARGTIPETAFPVRLFLVSRLHGMYRTCPRRRASPKSWPCTPTGFL
jgi:hypothetical protein